MRRRFIGEDRTDNSAALYDTADGIDENQFQYSSTKLPIKSILYILGFLIAGCTCFTFSALISVGYFDEKYSDRIWPLFILGSILMIPGGYYGWIIVCIVFRMSNYTVDDIPIL